MQLPQMSPRNTDGNPGTPGPEAADMAAGKAQGVPSQVSGSGATQAGDDKVTYGFWSGKENKYHAVKLGSRAEAFALAAKNGWEFDCVIPEGWK